jgi:hypothetical protein
VLAIDVRLTKKNVGLLYCTNFSADARIKTYFMLHCNFILLLRWTCKYFYCQLVKIYCAINTTTANMKSGACPNLIPGTLAFWIINYCCKTHFYAAVTIHLVHIPQSTISRYSVTYNIIKKVQTNICFDPYIDTSRHSGFALIQLVPAFLSDVN